MFWACPRRAARSGHPLIVLAPALAPGYPLLSLTQAPALVDGVDMVAHTASTLSTSPASCCPTFEPPNPMPAYAVTGFRAFVRS